MSAATMTAQAAPEFRAAGTDLSERRRSGVSTRSADRYCRRAGDASGLTGARTAQRASARLTTIAAIAADTRIAQAYPGVVGERARPRHAADPASCDARRQPRPALALLVFSQSAYRLPEEGRHRLPGPQRAIISTAWRSISAPASRRIPRPWRRRCSPMTRRSSPIDAAAFRSGELLGDGTNGRADHALASGEMISSIELHAAAPSERALYKRAISRTYAEWPLVELCARAVVVGRHRSSSSASRPAGSRRCRCASPPAEAALAGQPRAERRDASPRPRRQATDRRKAVADDGLQARSVERSRAGPAGADRGGVSASDRRSGRRPTRPRTRLPRRPSRAWSRCEASFVRRASP